MNMNCYYLKKTVNKWRNERDLTFGGSGTKDGGGLGSLFNISLLPDFFIRVLGSGWGLYSHTRKYAGGFSGLVEMTTNKK